MFKLLKALLVKWMKFHHLMLSAEQIVLNSWEPIDYKQTVYNIYERSEGHYQIEINFFTKTTGNPATDQVITIPLALTFTHAEFAFLFLQSIGQVFHNTNPLVFIIKNDMSVMYEWNLTKKVMDQPGFNPNAIMDSIKIVTDGNIPEDITIEKPIKPTHTGNWSVN